MIKMVTGAKPQPTILKKLRGNPGKRALNHREPKVAKLEPFVPNGFTDRQKEIWLDIFFSAPAGMISSLDAGILKSYVIALDVHEKASDIVKNTGLMIEGLNGDLRLNPAVGILTRQGTLIKALAAELGFTPSSRSRIKMPETESENDVFKDFLS
jgi:P27 family predicted phage terminase small subunit